MLYIQLIVQVYTINSNLHHIMTNITSDTLRVVNISEGTSVDGPGLRTSIYFAGCRHACEGCHNPQTWDFRAGRDMSIDEVLQVIDYNDFNVTFTGGDPLYSAQALVPLAQRIRQQLHKNIWCYTGFLWEDICDDPLYRPLLEQIDVIVDGPFILAQRDTSLLFRGSANQRLIDVKASLASGHTVEYKLM